MLVDEVCLLCTRTALCNPPGSKHFALTKVRGTAAAATHVLGAAWAAWFTASKVCPAAPGGCRPKPSSVSSHLTLLLMSSDPRLCSLCPAPPPPYRPAG